MRRALVRPGTSVEGTAPSWEGLAGLNHGEDFCCNAVILHRKNILGHFVLLHPEFGLDWEAVHTAIKNLRISVPAMAST